MHILVATADAQTALPPLATALGPRHQLEPIAPTAAAVLVRLARGGCDLVLLHDLAAAALVEPVRAAHRALPVLVITAIGDVAARVRALESGADDAVSEPWMASQMVARVDALERRAALAPTPPEVLEADGCSLDLTNASCRRGNTTHSLTTLEVDLLRWLLRHRGRVVSRQELLQHVWHVSPSIATRAIDVAVAALRRKLERDPAEPHLLISIRGQGYAWGPDLG